MRLILLVLSLLMAGGSLGAEESVFQERFAEGDEFEIVSTYETKSEGDSSSGSSRGTNAYTERVLSVKPAGIIREFDVRLEADEERELADWQFPAQVRDRVGLNPSLANRAELEARRDAWLTAAQLSQEACGKHYFTWTVFKVECDPEEILTLIDELDLTKMDFRDGAQIDFPGALSAARLNRLNDDGGLEVYGVEFEIDPDDVRASRAEAAVVIAQLLGKPITLSDAQAEQARIDYSGTINVRYEISHDRNLMRRIVESNLLIMDVKGAMESEYSKRTVERKRAGSRSSRPF